MRDAGMIVLFRRLCFSVVGSNELQRTVTVRSGCCCCCCVVVVVADGGNRTES